ncbi:MAG: hypothetical protein WBQ09_13895 [Terriglobales bacterium]
MTNETENNYDSQSKNTGKDYKKNPGQESGQHLPNQQDPSKKNPSQTDDSRPHDGQGSGQVEKRRA